MFFFDLIQAELIIEKCKNIVMLPVAIDLAKKLLKKRKLEIIEYTIS